MDKSINTFEIIRVENGYLVNVFDGNKIDVFVYEYNSDLLEKLSEWCGKIEEE